MKTNSIGVPQVAPSNLTTRRRFVGNTLRLGTAAAFGLGLLSPFQVSAAPPAMQAVAKEWEIKRTGKQYPLVLIWLKGGASQFDTFDPHPEAPQGIRSEYKPIRTSEPGVVITELFPKMSDMMHKVALFRNLGFADVANSQDHNMATAKALTGSHDLNKTIGANITFHPPINDSPLVVWSNQIGKGGLGYTILHYNGDPPRGGFPVFGGLQPNKATVVVSNINGEYPSPLPQISNVSRARQEARFALRENMEHALEHKVEGTKVRLWDEHYARARALAGGKLNEAFDISKEPDKIREMYGKTHLGNAALTARRMVDAGAEFVCIDFGYWDHHGDSNGHLGEMKERKGYKVSYGFRGQEHFTPTGETRIGIATELDLALSAIIQELGDRAVIVVASEFGRAPKIDYDQGLGPGRGHWPNQFFTIVAGPHIKPGVRGKSNEKGEIVGERYDAEKLGEAIFNLTGHARFARIGNVKTNERAPTLNLAG
ncbi:MAG: DUF1501 domain-containing protein [Candidatus Melainabacteria bacterium]|nr:DUF1501 domain-containing protein [Candidatus Melainabacteria bacterium]